MTPLEVADNPKEWIRYRDHLMALGMAGDRIEARAIPGLDTSMAWAHRDAWPDGVPTTRLNDIGPLDRLIAEQQAEATASTDPLGRVSDNDTDDSDAETEGNSDFEGVAVRIIHRTIRRMLVANTWPDPGFGDLDAHEWASTPTPSDRRIFQGGVGTWVILRILQSARAIDRPAEDVFDHLRHTLAHAHGLAAADLELLINGHLTVDAHTLVAVFSALRLTFDGQWKTDPAALADDVDRSLRLQHILELADHVPLAGLTRMLAVAQSTTLASPDAVRSPLEFQADLDNPIQPGNRKPDRHSSKPPPPKGRYRPLYEALVNNPKPSAAYTFAQIADLLAPDRFGNTGLPSRAIVADGRSWWSNGTSRERGHVRAWQAAGYLVQTSSLVFALDTDMQPDLEQSTVTFVEKAGRSLWQRYRHDLAAYTPPGKSLGNEELADLKITGVLHRMTRVPPADHLKVWMWAN